MAHFAPNFLSNSTGFELLVDYEPFRLSLKELGFSNPTKVQTGSIPLLLQGCDLVIKAETGSGKTLAFIIPALYRLLNSVSSKSSSIVLVLVPTRELAIQIAQVFETLTNSVHPVCAIGGIPISSQKNSLKEDARLVVGTPGRVKDLIKQQLLNLENIELFVLDEADEMLSIGFIEEVEEILSSVPTTAQGVFVSATISTRIDSLANRFLKRHRLLDFATTTASENTITHKFCRVGAGLLEKNRKLIETWQVLSPQTCIVFCNTKSDTELVELVLRRNSIDVERLNSDLSQVQRLIVMEKLRSRELKMVIATDIASRGIDIQEIDLVVNYSLPDTVESYIHRSGRTGRAGRKGISLTLLAPMDIPKFHQLKKSLDVEWIELT